MFRFFNRLIQYLGTPKALFFLMPLLMLILVVGTISQKWIGLHASLDLFFFSWVIWLYSFPLPGGMIVMSAITLNLTCKFLLKSRWSKDRCGTNLIHLGILILMIGGLATLIFKTDSVMVLPPNQDIQHVQDYVETDLVILKNDRAFYRRSFDTVTPRKIEELPFSLAITDVCQSCAIVLRPEEEKEGWVGAFQSMKLVPTGRALNPEETIQGLSFIVDGTDSQDGKYITFESFPKPPQFISGEDTYTVLVQRHKTELPFSISLTQFDKEMYTGTYRAKNYTSHIQVHDGDIDFPAIITMNEPLRYQGYTFFQSSFIGNDVSVLAVVKNEAYIFPYIASLLITLGLLWQLWTLRRKPS